MDEKEREIIEREGGVVDESEEKILIKPFWGWSILFVLCLLIFGWGMFIMMNVDEIERSWDFGQYEDTPGSSVVSSSNEDYRKAPDQIQLPGKSDQSKTKKQGEAQGSKR